MKKIIKISLISILVLHVTSALSAQEEPDSVIKENTIVIPPLADLIDSAMKHNAAVRFRQLDIVAKDAGLNSEKNYWTRNIGFQADTRYGTFDNFSLNSNGFSTSKFSTTSRQMNYGFGVYMKFPIVDMIDRKNQLKIAKVELEQAKSMEEVQREELRQLVIRQYQDVLLKQKLLNIQSLALGNARVNIDMVEKEFRSGLIQVSEYARISDIVSRVESDYEKAKTEFITAKMILEDIVGFSFSVISKK